MPYISNNGYLQKGWLPIPPFVWRNPHGLRVHRPCGMRCALTCSTLKVGENGALKMCNVEKARNNWEIYALINIGCHCLSLVYVVYISVE